MEKMRSSIRLAISIAAPNISHSAAANGALLRGGHWQGMREPVHVHGGGIEPTTGKGRLYLESAIDTAMFEMILLRLLQWPACRSTIAARVTDMRYASTAWRPRLRAAKNQPPCTITGTRAFSGASWRRGGLIRCYLPT